MASRLVQSALVLIAVGVCGVFLGRFTRTPIDDSLAREVGRQRAILEQIDIKLSAEEHRSSCPPCSVEQNGDSGLRAQVVEAVSSVLAEHAKRDSADRQTQEAPTPDNLEAYDDADFLLQEARARKRWTEKDRSASDAMMTRMTDEQRRAFLGQVVTAFNAGEIVPDFPGPPL